MDPVSVAVLADTILDLIVGPVMEEDLIVNPADSVANQVMVEDLTVDPVMDKDLTVDPVMDKDLTVDPGLADSVVDPVMVEDLTVGPDMVDMVLPVNQDSVVGQGTEVPASTVVPLTVDPVSTLMFTSLHRCDCTDVIDDGDIGDDDGNSDDF